MALKDIVGFQGIPTAAQSVTAVKAPLPGTPFTMVPGGSAVAAHNFWSKEPANGEAGGRWLHFEVPYRDASGNSTNKRLGFAWPIADLYGSPAGKVVFFGGRLSKTYTEAGRFSTSMFGIYDYTSAALVNPTNAINMVAEADIPGGFVKDRANYYEGMLDLVNNRLVAWVDGTLVYNAALPAWAATNPQNIAVVWGTPNGGPVTNLYHGELNLRDVYYKVSDGSADNFRLGPQVVYPLAVDTADAAGWAASAGTVVSALNTPVYTLADQSAPYAQSDPAQTPMKLSYVAPASIGKINGISIEGGGVRVPGTAANIKVKISDGVSDSPESTVTLGATPVLNTAFGVFEKTPSGNQYTRAELAALRVTVTPTN